MADPTRATLDRFADPSLWRVIRDVPVFDEHDEYDQDGKLVRKFDRAALEGIARRCNLREETTGDVSPIGPGHTLRQAKETDQPPIWAYGRNYHVGTFGPENKTAILVDWYVKPQHWDDVLSYPRRSVELWMKDGIIDWIALLRRTPMRDLGLITDLVGAGVNETDVLPRYLRPQSTEPVRVYERAGVLLIYERSPMADMATGRTMETDGDDVVQKCMKAFMAHPLMQHLSKKYAAEMASMPSGTNTGMVGDKDPTETDKNSKLPEEQNKALWAQVPDNHRGTGKDGKKGGYEGMKDEWPNKHDHQRSESDLVLRFAKIEREHADQAARLKAAEERYGELHGRYQQETRRGQLLKLQRDGFQLDINEELKDAAALSNDQFTKHLERIVRHYQKDPTGPWIAVTEPSADTTSRTGAVGEMTGAQLDEALQYQKEHDCEWKDAYEAVMKPAAKK